MTLETYDNLKQYIGSKNEFADDLINYGYTKGKTDERENIIKEINGFCAIYNKHAKCYGECDNCPLGVFTKRMKGE